jgi:hypothetical protein
MQQSVDSVAHCRKVVRKQQTLQENKKQVKTDSGEKQSHGSLRASFESMCESIKDCKSIVVQELALKKELLQEQMLLKKAQLEAQLKMKAEKHE